MKIATGIPVPQRWRWLLVPVALAVPYATLGYLLFSDLFANEGMTGSVLGISGVCVAWLINVMGVVALLEPPEY